MDANQVRRLQGAFAACGAAATPLGRLMCDMLGAGPAPAVVDLFQQFYRTISTEAPDVRLFLSGLHHLALTGEAPGFPEAAAEAVAVGRESLLDYMLSRAYQPHVVERSEALRRGALAAAARFGGGISLVEFGCSGGLALLLDKYGAPAPPVVGRYGLDPLPYNPADPADRLVLESFFWPDETERLANLRRAAAVLAEHGPLDIRQGAAQSDLLPLLAEAYEAMPPANTLLVMDSFVWPYLSDPERQQVAWQIQHLAAHLQPHKPLAWLQLEPFASGPVELRLHTFGWSDPEDREVRRLAEADPTGCHLKWLD